MIAALALRMARAPTLWLSLALALGLAAAWARGDRYRDRYVALIASTTRAQEQAERTALAARAAYQAQLKEQAHEADLDLAAARRAGDARLAAYAAAHRLRPDRAGDAGQAAAAAHDSGAPGDQRPGAAPDMVAVSLADLRICTDNTLRLEAAHEWAKGLPK